MVRSAERWAIAVREPGGGIHLESHAIPATSARGLRSTPLRGVLALSDALDIGVRALQIAVRIGTGVAATGRQLRSTLAAVGVTFVLLFVIGPGVAVWAARLDGAVAAVAEGLARVAMLAFYLLVVSRSPATSRVLAYHGAEHKTIAAFERAERMPEPGEARSESPIHTRCGTNFLTLFVLCAGVVFAVVPREPVWAGALWRALLVGMVAALAYEVMRAAARAGRTWWAAAIVWPGRLAQRLTTREPTDDQLEIAMAALRELLKPDGSPEA